MMAHATGGGLLVFAAAAVVLATVVLSVKYLLFPGEGHTDHIKRRVLR
jgi:hypothetical protein